MLYIRKVHGSNLSPEARYTDQAFFMIFLSPSGRNPGYYLKLGHDHFLPHAFQFVTPPDHSRGGGGTAVLSSKVKVAKTVRRNEYFKCNIYIYIYTYIYCISILIYIIYFKLLDGISGNLKLHFFFVFVPPPPKKIHTFC